MVGLVGTAEPKGLHQSARGNMQNMVGDNLRRSMIPLKFVVQGNKIIVVRSANKGG
jgi:hypothetical protein